MAPIFKKVAGEFVDKAVFVKVDTNRQPELSSRYMVRSLPTFHYFVGGKKSETDVGGIGEGPLRQRTEQMIRQAEIENTLLSLDALKAYYKEQDESKSDEDIATVHEKCVGMTKKASDCVGSAANQLSRRLRKKYGKAPKLEKRFTEDATSSKKSDDSSSDKKAKSKPSGSKAAPNLHLASIDQLKEELERRLDEQRDEEADDEIEETSGSRWEGPGAFPERMVIVGGGPAGMSAAIYGARAGLKPLVIAPSMGGQLQGKGVTVENYPSAFNLTGPQVIAAMREQGMLSDGESYRCGLTRLSRTAAYFGAVFEDDVVREIMVDRDPAIEYGGGKPKPITVITNETGTIETHSLIIATGAEANWLGIKGEWELRGGGVSSCAVCDGALYAGKSVLIVGGGDAAMEDALVLARTSRKVTVIHRRDKFRASKVLAERVMNHPLISVEWNTTVKEIIGKNLEQEEQADGDTVDIDDLQQVVSAAVLADVASGDTRTVPCDAVFVAIGHTPTTTFLEGLVEFDPAHKGYLKTKQSSTQTSVTGIFAAGDVSDAIYRQAITSAGSGAAAALDAERYLSEHGLGNEEAELEAELLADLMGDLPSGDEGGFNAYEEAGGRVEGMKESLAAEL